LGVQLPKITANHLPNALRAKQVKKKGGEEEEEEEEEENTYCVTVGFVTLIQLELLRSLHEGGNVIRQEQRH
jgi:hypothetical protein